MRTNRIIACAVLLFLTSCSNPAFKDLGSSLLSSTGLMSQSQSEALFEAGGKIVTAARPLTDEQEYHLGRTVSAVILNKYPLAADQDALRYVNSVTLVLARVSDRPEVFSGYHAGILATPEVNALSAPGGFIFVSRGFLKIIPNEDALAAVLAHEIAHIVKGHGVKAISQSNLSAAALIIGKEAASSYGSSTVQQLSSAFVV